MSSIDYKQKYLKYKNKYLELKALQEQNIKTGGYMYASGQYLFFIPENKKQLVDNEVLVKNKVIKSLDKFTTELGNCTRFLRIGSTSTGNNKTVYTNQGTWDVVKREAKKVKDASVEALDATKQGAKVVGEKVSQGYNAVKDFINKKPEEKLVVDATETIHTSDLKDSSDSDNDKQSKSKDVKEVQLGGDDDCDKLPIPLPEKLSGFKFDSDVNETNLVDYVKFINEKQGSEKIGRVVIVEKKTNVFGVGETRLKYDFGVSYEGDKVVVSKK